MGTFELMQIKSFKHNGHIHRVWVENWLVPEEFHFAGHMEKPLIVLINSHTRIQEASGQEWVSKVPAVSFFIPDEWFNVVALLEDTGIRYYCNVASPPYVHGNVLTYIDYDLDVIVMPDGAYQIVDEAEYQRHKTFYRYSKAVQMKVKLGLDKLLERINNRSTPFSDSLVEHIFERWKEEKAKE